MGYFSSFLLVNLRFVYDVIDYLNMNNDFRWYFLIIWIWLIFDLSNIYFPKSNVISILSLEIIVFVIWKILSPLAYVYYLFTRIDA